MGVAITQSIDMTNLFILTNTNRYASAVNNFACINYYNSSERCLDAVQVNFNTNTLLSYNRGGSYLAKLIWDRV